MVTSKMGDDDERPKSGEAKKSNRSNGSSDEGEKDPMSRYIVLELAENGDLFDFTTAVGEALGEEISRFYFHQLLSAVEYLHVEHRLVHRDLKLENILIDAQFQAKICDFTLAKTFSEIHGSRNLGRQALQRQHHRHLRSGSNFICHGYWSHALLSESCEDR
jgi:serine/threonine protein kinase